MTEQPAELSRMVDARYIDAKPFVVEASKAEREALAERFGIVSIESLVAEIALHKDGAAVRGSGPLRAAIVQSCAVSGEDFPVSIDEKLELIFVRDGEVEATPDEEIELDADELDEIPFTGDRFDLGEAVAQSLALAIDPYAEGPNADRVRKEKALGSDDAPNGPLAEALAAFRSNDG
ncbi:DUF177 domain-containing protein [Altererythrobacter sp. CAU 1778]